MVSKGLTFAVIPGRRSAANPQSRTIPSSSYPRTRVSSTPRPIGSIADVCGILDRPPSRAMTTESVAHRPGMTNTPNSSSPAKAGDPVRRGFSALSPASLEYWIARSSRAMTTRSAAHRPGMTGSKSPRHCERSEAIHLSASGGMDCFASLAMTMPKFKTHLRIPAAQLPGFCQTVSLQKQREQGMPGARCTRGLVCKIVRKNRTRAYRFSGNTPASPAQWLYGLWRALLGDEFVLSPSSAD